MQVYVKQPAALLHAILTVCQMQPVPVVPAEVLALLIGYDHVALAAQLPSPSRRIIDLLADEPLVGPFVCWRAWCRELGVALVGRSQLAPGPLLHEWLSHYAGWLQACKGREDLERKLRASFQGTGKGSFFYA